MGFPSFVLAAGFAVAVAGEAAVQETVLRSLRLDYFHTGSVEDEIFSFDRLVVEPLPWAGNPERPTDPTFFGKYRFEIFDAEEGSLLYSRGFGSIYGEWETTAEARERHRTFHESLRFPAREPLGPMRAVLHKRDATNAFHPVWEVAIDPDDVFVDTSQVAAERPGDLPLLEVERHGEPAHKVDLLLLGDGYTAVECGDEFRGDARAVTDALFAVEPFASRREDFNIWGLCPPSAQSGVSRPSTGIHRRTPVGATYDAFGSERYVLSFDNRAFRDVAAWAPYDVVEILVNNETYGCGGIFGQYATVAAKNDWLSYVFIHEFAHHFAALADEYYTSAVAYELPEEIVEPWEANVTANLNRTTAKWAALLSDGVPLPTPWPKEAFEDNARAVQERRGQIRAERRPEAEMSALFREQQAFEMALFGKAEHYEEVGAFEGGNYLPNGIYRPQMDCIMFSRNPVPFCAVCRATLDRVIDLYTASGPAK